MDWNEIHRQRLYRIIEGKWAKHDIETFDRFLEALGIKWVELDDELNDAPAGTIAIWEGPGCKDNTKKQCWIVPDDVALKLLAIGTP
jgi:hypothetical protein